MTVPTCPDWAARDLVRHMGGVHRWAARIVRDARQTGGDEELEDLVGGWPPDDQLVTWLRQGHRRLVEDLRAAPADLDCYTFLTAASPLAMWARRQAHETTIHRVDAESAAETVTSPEPGLAADGIDELLTAFVARPSSRFRHDPARIIEVATTDTDAVWTVVVGPTAITTERSPAPDPDLSIRGSAADLYLVLWNRRNPDILKSEGDQTLLTAWSESVKVRWA